MEKKKKRIVLGEKSLSSVSDTGSWMSIGAPKKDLNILGRRDISILQMGVWSVGVEEKMALGMSAWEQRMRS